MAIGYPDQKRESTRKNNQALCSLCLMKDIGMYGTHLCFNCEIYMCFKCYYYHPSSHNVLCSYKNEQQEQQKLVLKNFVNSIQEELTKEKLERIPEPQPVELPKHGFQFETYRHKTIKVRVKHDINVKILKDQKPSEIKGIALLRTTNWATITDYNNRAVKLVDLEQRRVTRNIRFTSKPWGVAAISGHFSEVSSSSDESFIAVSFPDDNQIVIIDITSDKALIKYTMNVGSPCYDITYANNKFVTMCEERHTNDAILRFINRHRECEKEISFKTDPYMHFSARMCRFALLPNKEHVYVANFIENIVVGFDYQGRVLSKYSCSMPTSLCIGPDEDLFITSLSLADVGILYRIRMDFPGVIALNIGIYPWGGSLVSFGNTFLTKSRNPYGWPPDLLSVLELINM